MSAIGPGDWVEAIGRAGAVDARTGIRAGGVYRVEALECGHHCSIDRSHDHPGIHLIGIARWPAGFAGCQFRPIYRPKADFIEALKQPAPSLESA